MCQLADNQPPWFESYPLSWVLRFEVNLVRISVALIINQAHYERLRKAAAHAYLPFNNAASTNSHAPAVYHKHLSYHLLADACAKPLCLFVITVQIEHGMPCFLALCCRKDGPSTTDFPRTRPDISS